MIADFDGDISTIFNKHTDDELPMLITRNLVVFPGVLTPIIIGRKQSLELLQIIRRRILGFVWMHACRGVNKIILLRQIQAAPRGRQIAAHAGAARYARLAHARDGLGAI